MAAAAVAVYILLAVGWLNEPAPEVTTCHEVTITIADENTNGFLSAEEIKTILKRNGLYPLKKDLAQVCPRDIEDLLMRTPFVNTAQCHKTKHGAVNICVTQRLPLIRVKDDRGGDYYLDDKGGIMPHSAYTADLIVATGRITEQYAKTYLTCLANTIMADELWRRQVVQINVLDNQGVELVPRVGAHVVYLGTMPQAKTSTERRQQVAAYAQSRLQRLEKFYKYGLSQAGWNMYSYINMEFDNQIICKKKQHTKWQ